MYEHNDNHNERVNYSQNRRLNEMQDDKPVVNKRPRPEPVESKIEPKVEETEIVAASEPKNEAPTIGVVNCPLLNVRAKPNKNADIVCAVSMDTAFVIDKTKSTHDWYSVCNSAGVEGFCMKKFITIK